MYGYTKASKIITILLHNTTLLIVSACGSAQKVFGAQYFAFGVLYTFQKPILVNMIATAKKYGLYGVRPVR